MLSDIVSPSVQMIKVYSLYGFDGPPFRILKPRNRLRCKPKPMSFLFVGIMKLKGFDLPVSVRCGNPFFKELFEDLRYKKSGLANNGLSFCRLARLVQFK